MLAAAAAGSPHVAGPPARDLSRDELAAAAAGIEVTWLYRRRGHSEASTAGEPCYTRNPPANPGAGHTSGDLVQVVEVVRDLARQDAIRGLSAGEKRMLARARLSLLQEG